MICSSTISISLTVVSVDTEKFRVCKGGEALTIRRVIRGDWRRPHWILTPPSRNSLHHQSSCFLDIFWSMPNWIRTPSQNYLHHQKMPKDCFIISNKNQIFFSWYFLEGTHCTPESKTTQLASSLKNVPWLSLKLKLQLLFSWYLLA